MDNQHKLIKGYRDLSPQEIELINEVKNYANQLGLTVEAVSRIPEIDQRAFAIAKTQLQTGFMWLIRSIAQPQGF